MMLTRPLDVSQQITLCAWSKIGLLGIFLDLMTSSLAGLAQT